MNPALPGGASTTDATLDDDAWSTSARLGYAFVPYGKLQQGRDEAANPNELAIDVHLATLQATLAAPTATTLDVQLPAGSLVTTQLGERTTSTGIGDLEVRVRQSFARWAGTRPALGAALGIATPTGPYVARSGAANLPPEASYLTLGRGVAWWLADLDARLPAGPATLFVQLAARGPLGRTDDGFDWGTEARATVTARYPIGDRLAALLSTDVQWRGHASEPDPFTGERAMSANAGGWQWAASPAASYRLMDGVAVVAGARIPIVNDVVGNQLVPQLGAFAAISYTQTLAKRRPRFAAPAGQITVVDYWATWCAPCVEITRLLEAATPRWPDVKIVKVDATAWPNDGAPALPEGAAGLPVVEIFDATGRRHVLLRGTDALRVVDEVDRLRTSSPRK